MPKMILPSSMVGLLAAFEPCFSAPSYRTFRLRVVGWILCLRRRTVTAVAVASTGVDQHHISVFHRFFSRARWSLDALGVRNAHRTGPSRGTAAGAARWDLAGRGGGRRDGPAAGAG